MSLLDKLSQAKTTLDNLLAFANNKTGKGDTSIGDAIKTLADGYGGGSSDVPFEFGGMNAELVSEYNEDYTLEDTTFVIGESVSTSSTSIKPTVTNRYTNTTGSPTVAYGDKDIVVVQTVNSEVEHEEGATGARVIKCCYVVVTWYSKRKTTDTSAKTTRQPFGTGNTNMVKYFDTSNAITRGLASYGFYGIPQTPSVSATANSTYVRVSSPILYYRASSTYESTTNIKLVKDVKWHWNVKVYAVDPFTSITSAINDLQDEWLSAE